MNRTELKKIWQSEESIAHIHGWDFSHIHGRYEEGNDIPWNYEEIIHQYLTEDAKILDYDTGGGEFLLSLHHPYKNTAATEGFPPNVELCKETLLPLGIDFEECSDAANIPFADESNFMMWVPLCGLPALLNGSFRAFLWISALINCWKCR